MLKTKLHPHYFTIGITALGLAVLLFINACAAESGRTNMANTGNTDKRVAGELIVDVSPSAEMFGIEMYADGMDRPFYSKAGLSGKGKDKMSFPLPRIPQQVRVIWRKNDDVRLTDGKIIYGGPLAGDYTIPVASRIPESIFEEIRKNGGALRIKFRLKPDCVMLGWDIQRKGTGHYTFDYFMAGGDFLDTRY